MAKRSSPRKNPPLEKALLAALAELMDAGRLQQIANADRGDDAEMHLAAVRKICDTLAVPDHLDWVPLEVLELTRWSRPEDWYAMENVNYRDHYEMRAFACAALLLQGEDADSWDSGIETIGNLMESLIRFQPGLLPFVPAALEHVAAYDFPEADHAFRLAAVLCVRLELEDMDDVLGALEDMLAMEMTAQKNTHARAKDYGKSKAFAGVRSLIQPQGWHCVGKSMASQAALVKDRQTRAIILHIAAQLQTIKAPKR